MGAVWAATNEATSRAVALKLLLRSGPELRSRLLREARACGALKHPNIIDVYDVAQTEAGEPFLVMELLSGETLAQVLEARRRLDLPETARVAQHVVCALEAAHALGVVHRDLKPANVFLHETPGAEERGVKVLDFGVAKLLSADDALGTVLGGVVGSPAYMSPEQARGDRDIDARSDIWSLGVVLFEMITGVRPFTGEPQQVLDRIARGPIPAISDRIRNADPRIVAIVSRCLQRERQDRFASVVEIGGLLEPLRWKEARASGEISSSAALAGPPSASNPLSFRAPSRPDGAYAEETVPISGAASPWSARSPAPSGADLLGANGIAPGYASNACIPVPVERPALRESDPLSVTAQLQPEMMANLVRPPDFMAGMAAGSLTAPLVRVEPDDATVPPTESRTHAAKMTTAGRRPPRIGWIAGIAAAAGLLSATFYFAVIRQPASYPAATGSGTETVAPRAADPPMKPEPSAAPAAGAAPTPVATLAATATLAAPAASPAVIEPTAAVTATVAPTPYAGSISPPPVVVATSRPAASGSPSIDRNNPFAPQPQKQPCISRDEKGNPCPKYQPPAP